ncbi:MAG TPA: hypothetical protein DD381_01555 [Lentisphaeria bacterium]|nr:MAG: hypothetical protein A2X47_10475 [Lentisphaerae bacterium GWF2_38_69]HBM15027.1 hypothetical protein [Lentisphaeria bacterium]
MFKNKIFSISLIIAILSVVSFTLYAKTVYVIEFNDFHGMLYEHHLDKDAVSGALYFKSAIENKVSSNSIDADATEVPGAVHLSNIIMENAMKDNEGRDAVVVSGGDNYQGTIVSYDTKGLPVNQMFKLIGTKVSAIGNHEFDWGTKYFEQWQKDGGFTFVAANLLDDKTGNCPAWCKPYVIENVDGVKIAFIGLVTLETTVTTSAKNLVGLHVADPWTVAQKWIDYLKNGKDPMGKPDVIIALTHIPSSQEENGKILGEEINSLCTKTKGLDAVLSAHSHLRVCGTINDIPVIQAKCYGKMYGILEIKVNDSTNKVESIKPFVYDVPYSGKTLTENTAGKILDKYQDIEKKYSRVIGKTSGIPYNPQTLSPLGVYMAELMAKASGCQIAMVNPYGIRSGLDAGNIRVEDLFRISPFNNTLVSMNVTGAQLQKIMEYGLSGKIGCVQFYGLNVVYDRSRPVGQRIVSMSLPDGLPIEKDKIYSLCVNDFMSTGGDGFNFEGAKDMKIHKELFVRDLMMQDIEKRKILELPPATELKDISKEEQKEAA